MRSKRRNGEATSGSENFSLLFSLLALLKDKNEKTRERERERLADSSSHLHAMYRTFLPSLPLSLNSPNQKMNSTRANQDIALRAARTLREMEALIFVLHALPVDWGRTPCSEMRQVDYMAATLFVVRVYDFHASGGKFSCGLRLVWDWWRMTRCGGSVMHVFIYWRYGITCRWRMANVGLFVYFWSI